MFRFSSSPTPGKIQKQVKSSDTFKKKRDVGPFYYFSFSCAFVIISCQKVSTMTILNYNKLWEMISETQQSSRQKTQH